MVREFMETLAIAMLTAVVKLNSGVDLDRAAMTRATDQSGWAELAWRCEEWLGGVVSISLSHNELHHPPMPTLLARAARAMTGLATFHVFSSSLLVPQTQFYDD